MNDEKILRITTPPFFYLGLLLAAFFLLKLVNVFTPLFHDELGVYGRALFYMIDHGPSLLPGDIDPQLSRGHPLFFVFSVSAVTTLLGGSYWGARLFILAVSMGLLVATYELGKTLWSKKVGILAAFLLAFQPLFFAQSTLILPEVMLSLLGTLSLLFYLRKQYLWYFLVASCLVLTKETAVVILGGIALHLWYKNKFRIDFSLIGRGLLWMSPIACFIGFLFIQKYQNGWFFFPYHTELMSFSVWNVFIRLLISLAVLLLDQGRFVLTFAAIYAYSQLSKADRSAFVEKNALGIAVILVMLAFSCLNYFMPRYYLLIFPLLMLVFVSILEQRTYQVKHLVYFFLFTIPFHSNFFVFRNDDNMGYLIVVHHMQQSIKALDKMTAGKQAKVFANFPELNAIEEPRFGYTTNPNYVATDKYDDSIDYIIKSQNKHLIKEEAINNVVYDTDDSIDYLLNNKEALAKSPVELVYESQFFYNKQWIYKTNN